MKKYKPFGTLAWIAGIVSILLLAAWIVIYIVNSSIGAATSGSVSMFETWYQILLFIFGIIGILGTGALIFLYIRQLIGVKNGTVEHLKVQTYGLKRSVWGIFSGVSLLVALVFVIGTPIANQYSSTINGLLNIQEYQTTGGGSVYYQSDYLTDSDNYDDTAMRNNSQKVATEIAADGSVLLWNKNNALPLAENSKVSLFGIGTVAYRLSGGGSGEIKAEMVKNFKEALETPRSEGGAGFSVNSALYNAYTNLKSTGNYGSTSVLGSQGKHTPSDFAGDNRYREFYIREANWDTVNSNVSGGINPTLTTYGDAAIMTITRDGCEDGDTWFETDECYDGNYLDLAYAEADILNHLQALKQANTIKKIIVLLNTAQVFQMKHLSQYDIDACIVCGNGGVTGFIALGKVLSGVVNPNGALVDTYAYEIDSAPSTNNFGHFKFSEVGGIPANSYSGGYALVYNDRYIVYQEGIYVGYRYYETRYEDAVLNQGNASSAAGVKASSGNVWKYKEEVAFPFGYGLSYTTFEFSNLKVNHTDGDFGGNYEVKVDVQNTGSIAGKTPVQVYLQKPYTDYDKTNKIEKSSVELCGFTKSGLLQPGEKQTYTINVKGSELKSYDSYNAKHYILESGDYYFAVGNGAHEALNNILANKGKSSANGMVDSVGNPTNGNSNLAKKISIQVAGGVDSVTFANSEWTGVEVTNQLDESDINLYEGTANQHITYLTRNNWLSSYPSNTGVSLKATNSKMVADLQYTHGDIDPTGYQMPLFSTETIDPSFFDQFDDIDEDNKVLTLIMLKDYAYDDPVWEDLLNQLSWEEINHLCSGGYLNMQGAISVGLPSGRSDDGTSGVRTPNNTLGTLMGFPNETVMAQTFDVELVERLGDAFGHECLHVGVQQLYAPSADMHRNPYGGRNWEYYSEDPFISGKMLASEVKGIQSRGVITTVKHFAFNDQEINRLGASTFFNEQTAREINLKTFEIGINEGGILGLMESFPRIGTKYGGSNVKLMQTILRKEWTFKGLVETDSCFGQLYQELPGARAEAVCAGISLWMDGSPSMIFNNYSNNAKVVCGAREAAHGILYACLHSLRMNGIASNSKTVYVEAWWRSALNTGTVVSCFVTAGLALLATVSFALFPLFKTKALKKIDNSAEEKDADEASEETEEIEENNNKNNEAKRSIVKSLIPAIGGGLTFLALFGVMIGFGASSIKVDAGGNQNAFKSKTFCAVNKNVYTNGVKNDEENCIGALPSQQELIITYYVNASESCDADLSVIVSKCETEKAFTSVYNTLINDVAVTSNAVINSSSELADYDTIEIGTYQFNEGLNTITFKYVETNSSQSHNFRAINLKSKVAFTLEKNPYVFEMKGIDEKTYVASGAKKNANEDCIGWDSNLGNHLEFAFSVNSSKATTATLTAVVSGKPNETPLFTNTYLTKINGVSFTSEATMPQTSEMWTIYESVVLGTITLNEGDNLIEFKYYPSDWKTYNFRSIVFENYASTLSWGSSVPEPSTQDYTFNAINDNVIVASGAKKFTDENCIGWDSNLGDHVEFSFPIKSSEAVEGVTFKVVVSGNPSSNPLFTDTYQTYINGTKYNSPTAMPTGELWTSYQEIIIGEIDLISGENVITFKYYPSDWQTYNFRNITIANCSSTLTWGTVVKEFKFNAADEKVVVASGAKKIAEEDCIGWDANLGDHVEFTFPIKTTAAVERAVLKVIVSGNPSSNPLFTDTYQTYINDVKYNSTTAMPTGELWTSYQEITIGEIDLTVGNNTLTFKYYPSDWQTYNFRSISILTSQADISWQQ